MSQSRAAEKGQLGQEIAQRCWPGLRFTRSGSKADVEDRVDALDVDWAEVQIKTDAAIARTGRIFVEFFKRKRRWQSYGRPGPWHSSLSRARRHIFVTSLFAIKVETSVLAEWVAKRSSIESGPPLVNPNGTALGFYIPVAALRGQFGVEIKTHQDEIAPDEDYARAEQQLLDWAESKRPASPEAWR